MSIDTLVRKLLHTILFWMKMWNSSQLGVLALLVQGLKSWKYKVPLRLIQRFDWQRTGVSASCSTGIVKLLAYWSWQRM